MNDTLEQIIQFYVKDGYRLVTRSENSAQLVKPKQFSAGCAILALLLAVVPFIIYLLMYAAEKDKTRFVVVSDDGQIGVTDENGQTRPYPNLAAFLAPPPAADNELPRTMQIIVAVIALVIIVVVGVLAYTMR